jgi:hypothetical protein
LWWRSPDVLPGVGLCEQLVDCVRSRGGLFLANQQHRHDSGGYAHCGLCRSGQFDNCALRDQLRRLRRCGDRVECVFVDLQQWWPANANAPGDPPSCGGWKMQHLSERKPQLQRGCVLRRVWVDGSQFNNRDSDCGTLNTTTSNNSNNARVVCSCWHPFIIIVIVVIVIIELINIAWWSARFHNGGKFCRRR